MTSYAQKSAKSGVIGLGYVGLPFCIAAANHGLDVLGFDIDQNKCTAINTSKSYLKHISEADLSGAAQNGHFKATVDFSRISEPDILVICVPTPLTAHLEPDLSGWEACSGRRIWQWGHDATLIVTDHNGVDFNAIVKHASLVGDTRNVCYRAGVHGENLILA